MSLPDAKNIGSDKTIQNPQTAIESATGTYSDPIPGMSPEQRIVPPIPRGPETKPFSVTGTGTGGR